MAVTHLSNPGLPDGSLDQLTYELFEGAGIALVVSGPYDLALLVSDLKASIPFFAESVALQNGLATHPSHSSLWAGLDGPMGAAVALFVHPSDAAIATTVLGQFQRLDGRWHRSQANRGDIDAYAGTHIKGAATVPAGELLK